MNSNENKQIIFVVKILFILVLFQNNIKELKLIFCVWLGGHYFSFKIILIFYRCSFSLSVFDHSLICLTFIYMFVFYKSKHSVLRQPIEDCHVIFLKYYYFN